MPANSIDLMKRLSAANKTIFYCKKCAAYAESIERLGILFADWLDCLVTCVEEAGGEFNGDNAIDNDNGERDYPSSNNLRGRKRRECGAVGGELEEAGGAEAEGPLGCTQLMSGDPSISISTHSCVVQSKAVPITETICDGVSNELEMSRDVAGISISSVLKSYDCSSGGILGGAGSNPGRSSDLLDCLQSSDQDNKMIPASNCLSESSDSITFDTIVTDSTLEGRNAVPHANYDAFNDSDRNNQSRDFCSFIPTSNENMISFDDIKIENPSIPFHEISPQCSNFVNLPPDDFDDQTAALFNGNFHLQQFSEIGNPFDSCSSGTRFTAVESTVDVVGTPNQCGRPRKLLKSLGGETSNYRHRRNVVLESVEPLAPAPPHYYGMHKQFEPIDYDKYIIKQDVPISWYPNRGRLKFHDIRKNDKQKSPNQQGGHEKPEEPKSYLCNLCRNPYSSLRTIKHHIKTYHFQRERQSCPVCGKEFSTRLNFRAHYRNEHEGAPAVGQKAADLSSKKI